MNKLNLKYVDKSTWIRTAALICALVNQAFVIFGISDKQIDENSFVLIASYVFTLFSSVWSWWKNNSFTKKAQSADNYMVSEENSIG